MTTGHLLSLAVLGSIAVGILTPVSPADAAAGALAAAATALACDPPAVRRWLVVAALAAGACGHGASARNRALAPPLLVWYDARAPEGARDVTPVLVTGTLAEDAERTENGARLVIDVRAVTDASGEHALTGRVQAHVGGALVGDALASWTRGRTVRAPVTLRRPEMLANPGGPSLRWQALRRRFDLGGTIKSATLVGVARAGWADELAARARARVRRAAAEAFTGLRDETASIVTAILIGDRGGLDPAVVRRLQVAGTYHVIAISGGNIALLAVLCHLGLALTLRSFRAASALTMTVIAAYGWLVGGDPSVARAVAAACLYVGVGLAGVVPAALDVLLLVGLGLALLDPLIVVDAGAWLSFGATAGIILCAARLSAWVGGLPPDEPRATLSRVWRATVGLFAATAAAEFVLLPVSATLFSRVSVAGLVLNFVAIPAMAVIQLAGAAALALALVSRHAMLVTAWCADAAVGALIGSARLVDAVPMLAWRVPAPSAFVVVTFFAALAVVILDAHWTRRRLVGSIVLVGATLDIALAPGIEWARPSPGWLRLTMVDVGQGDALIVQFPTGQTLVVDGGSATPAFDLGERVVTPALWALGARRVDWVAFTHADLDHIGGTRAITDTFRPREVWEGVPVPRDPKRQALHAMARRQGAAWRSLQWGSSIEIGDVSLRVLSPPVPDWERQKVRNDDSLVFQLRYREADLLLTGDIGVEAERSLDVGPRGRLRVLKVAHHGSRTSSDPAFVRVYEPHVALVSVGRGNLFGHPAPEVLGRLSAAGTHLFRTDRDGAVTVETDGRELRVATWRGAHWTARVWPASSPVAASSAVPARSSP